MIIITLRAQLLRHIHFDILGKHTHTHRMTVWRVVSSGVSVVCDGSVAGSVHPRFPAALPLPQSAHQRAVSPPREGAAAGTQSVWQRLALALPGHTSRLSLTRNVWGRDMRWYTTLHVFCFCFSTVHLLPPHLQYGFTSLVYAHSLMKFRNFIVIR